MTTIIVWIYFIIIDYYYCRIQKMRINAKEHMALTEHLDPENPYFEVFVCPELQTLISGGIEIFGKYTGIIFAA